MALARREFLLFNKHYMKLPTRLFSASLSLPDNAKAFQLSRIIRAEATDLAVLETDDYAFNPIGYADSGGCELIVKDDALGHWEASWDDGNIELRPRNAVMEIVWRSLSFTLVVARNNDCGRNWFIVGDTLVACEQFFAAVCRWYTEGDNAIMVFDQGYFDRDEDLREEIRARKLSDMTLSPGIRKQLNVDVLDFFGQKDWYAKKGLSWKRGLILYGPPGNGKTQTIRALINEAKVATIYVRSLWGYRLPPEVSIKRIFHRAREISPCVVVMEDVDSLITPNVRSYFLNELDGMRNLDGVMTIVTTNHLEKLDVAIRNRPSRFDVKMEFPNPAEGERSAYLNKTLKLSKLEPEYVKEIVERTDGLSFAGLQEFVRSTAVRKVRVKSVQTAIGEILDEMVGAKPTKKSKKNKKKPSK